MKLETKRLTILPLTPAQLALWTDRIPQLEKELDCSYQAEPMEGIFKEIVSSQLLACKKNPAHYMWYTFWFLIRKSDRTVVGSASFKDIPNEKGEVEIGYGLGKAFEHNGYMTEAVKALCRWALGQDGVQHVTAETDPEGSASQNILKTCGFTEFKRDETIWWRL